VDIYHVDKRVTPWVVDC